MKKIKEDAIRILIATPCLILSTTPLMATERDGFSWNGNFDFYYQYSPEGHSPSSTTGPKVIEGRYFDRHSNELTLSMAELIFQNKMGRTNLRIDLAAGEAVDQMSGGGATSITATNPTNPAANEATRNITQAILSYQATDRLSFHIGKFYTNVGLELTRAKDNWQYSRSYLFNYGPFWHTGGYVSYAVLPNKMNVSFYALNAWDGRISQEANKSLTLAFNINYQPINSLMLNYNYIGGKETSLSGRRDLHELNALYKISENLSAAFDIQYGSQNKINSLTSVKWGGAAVYLKARINEFYYISPRFEYFYDGDGFSVAGGLSTPNQIKQKISALTLTNSFDLGSGLEFRAEARYDRSTSDQFLRTRTNNISKSQQSYTLAVLYAF